MNSTPDWTGVGTREESDRLIAAHAYFRSQGEAVEVYSPDFFRFWIQRGLTPEEIYDVACNRRRES